MRRPLAENRRYLLFWFLYLNDWGRFYFLQMNPLIRTIQEISAHDAVSYDLYSIFP